MTDSPQEKHFYDTLYEVWRRGENPDAVNADRVYDEYYMDYSPHESADQVLRNQRKRHEEEGLSENSATQDSQP